MYFSSLALKGASIEKVALFVGISARVRDVLTFCPIVYVLSLVVYAEIMDRVKIPFCISDGNVTE